MKCTTLLLSVCVAAVGVASVLPARAQAPNSAPARRIVIKVGTLAPEGTPWHDALQEIGATWKKASGGQITPLLELGVSTETFDISGGAGLVQTSSVQVPSTMLADQVSERPLSSRNIVSSTMFLPGVTPPRADSRISNVRLAGAAVVSVYLGLGIGHAIIGYGKAGLFFLQTQGVGALAFGVGIGMGYAGSNEAVGSTLAYSGAAIYVGSRIWEVVDLLSRAIKHNAKVAGVERALEAARKSRLSVIPVIDQARRGMALSVTF